MNKTNIPQIGPFLDMPIVDKDGKLTDVWKTLLQQFFDAVSQTILPNNEGISLPQQDSSNISILDTTTSIGNILFNSSTGKGMINESGTFKEIVTI